MSRQRQQVTITLPPDVIEWVDSKIEDLTFANRSHAIEKALVELRESLEKEE